LLIFKAFKLALAVFCALACFANADKPAPILQINLDLPAKERWVDLTKEYAQRANITLQYLRKMVGPGTILHPVVENLRKAILQGGGWKQEHLDEMEGIATTGGFTIEDIQLANLFYEFGTLGVDGTEGSDPKPGLGWGCTSIVAQHTNGSIMHARNQDYSLPGLVNITLHIEFTRGGKVVYAGETFAGYIGVPTAMHMGGWHPQHAQGGFSISADSRFNGGGVNLHNNIEAAKQGAKTIGIFIREMVETAPNYAAAVKMLNETKVIAPAYYIIAGTKSHEGAVVTRSRPGPDESDHQGIWSIEDGTTAPDGAPSWFRLETNWYIRSLHPLSLYTLSTYLLHITTRFVLCLSRQSPLASSIIPRFINRPSLCKPPPAPPPNHIASSPPHTHRSTRDHWKPDGSTDGRRKFANGWMEKIGQDKVDLATMFGGLSKRPSLAKDTVYTSLMFPETGYYHVVLRDQNF
jgi:hypothetical protein